MFGASYTATLSKELKAGSGSDRWLGEQELR